MKNIILEQQSNLYKRMMSVLYSESIESNEEIASLLDIKKSVSNAMHGYNDLLVEKSDKQIEELNNSLGYNKLSLKHKKLPKVCKIVNYNTEKNNSYIRVSFGKDEFNQDGSILLGYDKEGKIRVISTLFDLKDTEEFIKNNYNLFEANFKALSSFKTTYPNTEIYFKKDKVFKEDINPNNQTLGNGFISARIKLTDPARINATLVSLNDLAIAVAKTSKFGQLYDYLEYYNDEFLSKIPVDVEELNPVIKDMYNQYINLDKDKEFTLIRK